MLAIKNARKAARLTQQQLADRLGVKRATISMWEIGASSPRAEMLRPLARVLGCTIDELLPPERDTA